MAALESLQKLSDEDKRKFIHGAINGLCQKDGLHYEEYAKLLSLSEYGQLKNWLCDILRKTTRKGMDRAILTDTLTQLGVPQEVGVVIAECIWVRKEEVHDQLVRDSSAITSCSLKDYDWKTKLVLASDKMGSIQEPILSLDLMMDEGGTQRNETIELTPNELSKLVSAIEAANKMVVQLRS
jgi:hypothetical protein